MLSVGTYLFLDVDWLARVLAPLLNHKGIEYRDEELVFGDMRVTEPWQDASLRKLKDKGILERQLATALWPGYSEHVLAALRRIGLAFPCPGDDGGGLVVPLRLPETRPLFVEQHVANCRNDHQQKSLTMHWKMPHGVPPGAVERIVSRCSYIGAVTFFWRFGVSGRVEAVQKDGGDGFGRSWFMLEYDRYGQLLVLTVWGDITKAAVWATVSYVAAVVRDMPLEYPGLRWEAFLGCPDHPTEAMCISGVREACRHLVQRFALGNMSAA